MGEDSTVTDRGVSFKPGFKKKKTTESRLSVETAYVQKMDDDGC